MADPYWSGDGITLYLGDCREVTGWLAADVLVTDPPYGIGWRTGQMSTAKIPVVESIAGDESTRIRDEALTLWGRRTAIVFGTWRLPRPPRVAHRLIWHKAEALPGLNLNRPFYSAEEEIYLIGSGWVNGDPLQNVIVTHERRDGATGFVARSGHPVPKPVGLMETLIGKCPPGTIADPFAGSGSTLVAARNQGRKAIGVEIDERYAERAARSLDQGILTEATHSKPDPPCADGPGHFVMVGIREPVKWAPAARRASRRTPAQPFPKRSPTGSPVMSVYTSTAPA